MMMASPMRVDESLLDELSIKVEIDED